MHRTTHVERLSISLVHRRVTVLIVTLALLAACGDDSTDPDILPFIEAARASLCADLQNDLFTIVSDLHLDGRVVLHHRTGSCADWSYGVTLFGQTPNDELCIRQDSIAGPVESCQDPSYSDLFDTIVANIDEEGLGLGSAFEVRQVQF